MARLSTISTSLLALELTVATTTVVLFSMAYPDRFRSRLWENGGEEGWNSNPNKRIYFYANHREPPEIPLIWSQRLTDSNLAVAILSLVIFLARGVMAYLAYLPRYADVLYDLLLAGLWTASVVGQSSEDCSDPEHPSARPWYLRRSCSDGWAANREYCRAAQASFAFSVVAVVLYVGRLVREVLMFAYRRGREDGRGWALVKSEEEEEEEKLMAPTERYDPGLSPVLAFFPSQSIHRQREWEQVP